MKILLDINRDTGSHPDTNSTKHDFYLSNQTLNDY